VSSPAAPRRPLSEDEFLSLSVRFLENAADEKDRAALEGELFASRQRRDQFVELCIQRSELGETLANESLTSDQEDRGHAHLRRGDIAAILREDEYGVTAPAPVWGSTPLWLGGMGVALALLFAVWFGWRDGKADTPVARGFDPYLSPQYIATLTGSTDADWGRCDVATDVGARLFGGRMELVSGSAELTFDSGARVVLQGPATLVLHSDKGGLLERGRLVARVPQRAKGFSIKTATTHIIDLGTEFGVAVAPSGEVLVQVFSGRVQAGASGMKPGDSDDVRLLTGGSAVRHLPAEKAEWEPIAYEPNAFLRRLPGGVNRYPAELAGYWNFDEQGGPMLDDAGWNDGSARGGAARTAGLVGSGAAQFANQPGQRVDVGDGDGKFAFTDGVTIEALFVSGWSGQWLDYDEFFRKEDREQRILLSFQHDPNVQQAANPVVPIGPCLSFGLNLAGKYSELDMPLDGQDGRPALEELTDGRMHHVAATYDAKTGVKAIYIDGTLRMSTTLSGPIESGGPSPALIGNQENNDETFQGTIDEVAIYKAALSAETIAEHWRRAQAGQAYFP
jgi:hypothetical protein